MSSLGKKGLGLFLAPLACLSLSANAVIQDRTLVVGPLLDGEDLEIYLSFYKGNYGASTVAYCDLYGDGLPSSPTGLSQTYVSNLDADSRGYATFHASLPGALVKAGKVIRLEAGLCSSYYYRGIDASYKTFAAYETFKIKKGRKFFEIDETGIFETQNEVFHLDEKDPSSAGTGHDSYDVEGLCSGRVLTGRKVPLDELKVEYFCYGAKPHSDFEAELRILDYPEDFASMASSVGAYASIPLKTNLIDIGNGNYRYTFALTRSYYYSRIDLRASKERILEEPSFSSKSFFLPLREGHDEAVYRYQVVLSEAGAFGDTLVLDNSACSTRSYFGDCIESEYCVVGGEA